MSLLSVIQDVCDEVGVPKPTAVVGSSDATAIQLLAIAKTSQDTLAKRWALQQLTVRHSFVAFASASVASYTLPSDFDRFLNRTWYDQTNRRRVYVANETQWQDLTRGALGQGGVDTWFRVFGDLLYIWPVRTSGSTVLAYDYQSENVAETSANTAKRTFTADADVSHIDEHMMKLDLIWRFKRAKGLTYADERKEFEDYASQYKRTDGTVPDLNAAGTRLTNVLAVNIPEGSWPSS